jgi:two-component system sensor histidine kinase SaeS
MSLRNQLLIINLLSHGILVLALLVSYNQMLLTLKQTQLLTIICLLAALVSMLIYWLMTLPIIKSIQNLVLLTDQLGKRRFQVRNATDEGPKEFRELGKALHLMGAQLEESFKQLEEGEKARRELIANVSHDLRTPIAAIQSMLEALQDSLIDDIETKERYLKTSLHEVYRLRSLIQDLFELSKLEENQELIHPQLTFLDSILLEVLEAYSVHLKDKQIYVDIDFPKKLPLISMIPTKISRVVSNLLQNAIAHSPANGKIELSVIREPNQVKVIIRDEGKGIDPAYRSRIFERFFRIDYSRNKELGGSGLGLAIAKSLVELHKGQIGVNDRSDKKTGSEFWFTLPLHQIDF